MEAVEDGQTDEQVLDDKRRGAKNAATPRVQHKTRGRRHDVGAEREPHGNPNVVVEQAACVYTSGYGEESE